MKRRTSRMAWLYTSIKDSLMVLFSMSTAPPPTPDDEAAALESIRDRMMQLIVSADGEHDRALLRRVRYASDVQTLWFMRSELMALLARAHGEAAAREKLAALSGMFSELLPNGLRSRPSPLAEADPDTAGSPASSQPPR